MGIPCQVRLCADCLRCGLVGQHEIEPPVDLCLVGGIGVAYDGGEVGEVLLYRFIIRHGGCDLRFGWMSRPGQDRGSWLFVCST
jgi:hypothetical protein